MQINITITRKHVYNALSLGLPFLFALWEGVASAQMGQRFKGSVALALVVYLISFVLFGILRLRYSEVAPKERLIGLGLVALIVAVLLIPLPW